MVALMIAWVAWANCGAVWAELVDNGDGTVTDTSTGLMWQKASADTDDDGVPNTMVWQDALAYCENLILPEGGYTDWRLPNILELRSIVDYSTYNPAIDTAIFPDTVSSYYWSSTTYANDTNNAWRVSFYSGNDYSNIKYNDYYVRAVRGGQ
jgi:hypothetical protein